MCREGFLIVVEGCDGVGKGAVKSLLQEQIQKKLDQDNGSIKSLVYMFQQPTVSAKKEIGQIDPGNWLRLLYLFMKDRERQYFDRIKPTLACGDVVLLDRCYHSSCVYQGILGDVSSASILKAHGPWAIQPDVTFIFHIDPDEIERRLQTRSEEKEMLEKLEGNRSTRVEIQHRYRELVKNKDPLFDECVLIDASGSPEDIANLCMNAMAEKFDSWKKKRDSSLL